MQTNQANRYWRNKLLAFLHDPPTKPLDIPGHGAVRECLMRQAGFDPAEIADMDKRADWNAAAADRFPFPDHAKSKLKSAFTGGSGNAFRHPLGGSDYVFPAPFSTPTAAEEIIQTVQAGIDLKDVPEENRAWANFFLHWRRWPMESAFRDERTAFLPADTRIPDHTIWCHNGLVSALQRCYEDGGKPAFLLMQLGPVQEFIAQARSTRDLWSGSYLLSWVTAHAIKTVTDELGPDHVIFPSLRGVPLFDLLHKKTLYDVARFRGEEGRDDSMWERMALSDEAVLTPALPNRFLALVPAGDQGVALAGKAAENARKEFERISADCWHWFAEKGHALRDEWRQRFDRQIKDFIQGSWQVTPWGEMKGQDLVEAYQTLHKPSSPGAKALASVHAVATQTIPALGHSDDPIVKNGDIDSPGFAWAYEYARAARALDARRQLRDFNPWPLDPHGTPKDSLSGKEEVVGDEKWWKTVCRKNPFAILFRSQDRFGAVNLCKKVWHLAYIKKHYGLDVKSALSFESVPGVAAGQWRKDVARRMADPNSDRFYQHMERLQETISTHAAAAGLEIKRGKDLSRWVKQNDPEIFLKSTWMQNRTGFPEQDIHPVLDLLREKGQQDEGSGKRLLSPPPSAFAVLALDGDKMGQWIAGEKTPELFGQFSREAQEYFKSIGAQTPLTIPRPVSPAYHLQFSEALTNFALYLTRPIVEHFGGQLIYAGGDDVLAMLPASDALRCAQALRAAFRGEKRLCEWFPEAFDVYGAQGGFVKICDPVDGQPTWPLIVPGPRADVSVGIAIAHAHTPLQNVVRAAQGAEKRAKNRYGRAAFSVTLYKRSGETIEWGSKWESGALAAYEAFLEVWRDDPFSGRRPILSGGFPHAFLALLTPYELDASAVGHRQDIPNFPFRDVIRRELKYAMIRQSITSGPDRENSIQKTNEERLERFLMQCNAYLDDLCGNGKKRPLPDFANMFRIGAFLERGE